MTTASSKVKYISGMATSLRFRCFTKSFNSTPVSIASKTKVLEFDSFLRETPIFRLVRL